MKRTILLLYALIAVLVVTALSARLSEKLNYTGDEPRYLLQALSTALDGVPIMSEEHYETFREAHKNRGSVAVYPYSAIVPPAQNISFVAQHPVLVSFLLAPVSASWPLKYVRLIPFAIGVTGLCFLAKLIVNQTTGTLSTLACFVPAAFCFPALPYHFLALPEIFLFTLSSIAFWNLGSVSTNRISGYIPAIACSWLAPVVHLRGLALFVAVAGGLGLRLLNTNRGRRWRPILIFAAAYLAALASVFLLNSMIQGSPLGWVNTRPSWKTRVFEDVFIHYRHGLLAYAPIWLISFSGLIAALKAGKRWALPALIFLGAIIMSSANAIGEAYPGRFWGQAVPVLALCLSGFTEGVLRRPIKVLIYLPLIALSLANSLLFLFYPDLHLAARSGALPYDRLFEIFPAVNFGFWLDVIDSSFVRIGAVCFCLLAVLLTAFASIARSMLLEVTATVVLFVGFEAHRVRVVPITTTAEPNAVLVRLVQGFGIAHAPIRLRFQAPWKEVGPRKDESIRPVIEVADGDRHWNTPIMSGSVLCHKRAAPPAEFSMRLKWSSLDPAAVDPAAPGADFQALACNSFLRRLW